MRGSVLVVSVVTTVTVLLAGCSDTATPDRAAAAMESTQPAPGGEVGPADDPDEVDVVAPEVPDTTEESSPRDEPTSSDGLSAAEDQTADVQDSPEKSLGSKLCMMNDSSQTVNVTTASASREAVGELAPGDELCEDNFNAFSSKDLARGISVNGVELMSVTMNNPFVGLARVVMYQPGNRVCGVNDIAGPGKLGGAKDDGVLRYQLMRVTPYSLKPQQIEYQLVLSDSEAPTSGGRSVACF